MNGSAIFYLMTIPDHRLFQSGTGLARRREQSVNKLPGLLGIELNLIALIDNLKSHFTNVRNDKLSHRAPLNRGRFLE